MNAALTFLRGLSVLVACAALGCQSDNAPTAGEPPPPEAEEQTRAKKATSKAADAKPRRGDQPVDQAPADPFYAARGEGSESIAVPSDDEGKIRARRAKPKPRKERKRFRPRLDGADAALSKAKTKERGARARNARGLGARGVGSGGGGIAIGGLGSEASAGAAPTASPPPPPPSYAGPAEQAATGKSAKGLIGRLAGSSTSSSTTAGDVDSSRPGGGKKVVSMREKKDVSVRDKGGSLQAEVSEIAVDEERANGATEVDGEDSLVAGVPRDSKRHEKPESFLPRMFYFDPTYLGGNAAAKERRRRLAEALPGQRLDTLGGGSEAFDPPADAGMGLTLRLDRPYLDRPGRVFLEVGLRGSDRFGWRRPPLDVMVVVAPGAWTQARAEVDTALEMLLRRLGAQDRMGLVVAGLQQPLIQAPVRPRELRWSLPQELEKRAQEVASRNRSRAIPAAMELASQRLNSVMTQTASIPGTQTIILLTGPDDSRWVERSRRAAHRLTTERAVFTSVVELDRGGRGAWWEVAAAGYGNYHRVGGAGLDSVIEAELASLSRVVARLLRLNVRLGPHTRAIRVVGTRRLSEDEVRQVKAREVAIDTQLSKAQGVKADRGDDDDGVQTVIPYFYGGDSHVVLIELWVDRPGPVADVTLRYKDMVNLDNATARASASLGAGKERTTRRHRAVSDHVRGATVGEHLKIAGQWVKRGDIPAARRELTRALQLVGDRDGQARQLLESLRNSIRSPLSSDRRRVWAEALTVAGERRLSRIR